MSQQTINTPRDTTFKSTENTPRNIADVLADELAGIAAALDPTADDYDDLSNKPQVNGVTLSGNKTSKQLGIRQTIPLTSAQYAQLTSAEKMDVDKDYIITDENATAAPIDDSTTSQNSVWSSYKTDAEIDAVDSKLSTTTGDLSKVSGLTSVTLYNKTLYKSGNTVSFLINFSISGTIAGTGTNLFNVPDGFIPSSTRYIIGYGQYGSNKEPCMFAVTSDGKIKTANGSSTMTSSFLVWGSYCL